MTRIRLLKLAFVSSVFLYWTFPAWAIGELALCGIAGSLTPYISGVVSGVVAAVTHSGMIHAANAFKCDQKAEVLGHGIEGSLSESDRVCQDVLSSRSVFHSISDAKNHLGSTLQVDLDSLHPSQQSVGKDLVKNTLEKAMADVSDIKKLKQYQMDLLGKEFPAIVGPGGVIFLSDGHHRAYVAQTIQNKLRNENSSENVFLQMKVVISGQNYLDLSWSEFGKQMLAENRIYLFPELRKKLLNDGSNEDWEVALTQLIPGQFTELPDDPLRSAIGKILDEEKLKFDVTDGTGTAQKVLKKVIPEGCTGNFLEFHLAENVAPKLWKLVQNQQMCTSSKDIHFTPAAKDALKEVMFTDQDTLSLFEKYTKDSSSCRTQLHANLMAMESKVKKEQLQQQNFEQRNATENFQKIKMRQFPTSSAPTTPNVHQMKYTELENEINQDQGGGKLEIGAADNPLCWDCHQISIFGPEVNTTKTLYQKSGKDVSKFKFEVMDANDVGKNKNFSHLKLISYANGHLPSSDPAENKAALDSFYQSLDPGGVVYVVSVWKYEPAERSFLEAAKKAGFQFEKLEISDLPVKYHDKMQTTAIGYKLVKSSKPLQTD